jgi:nitrogen-specific signal transduction histidine kinase
MFPMVKMEIPYKKLHIFRQRLGIRESELKDLEPLRTFFAGHKDRFARYFYDYFMGIPEAKLIIEHEHRAGYLMQAWAHWFEALFCKGLDEEFLGYLWKVGMKHVEIKLDKRFSNMGFSVVRQFCQEVVIEELPPDIAVSVLRLVDKLVDFCLLVETDAYIESTTRCDIEIIKGIADRIRNPVTIIGGNINRLMKHADNKDPAFPVYEFIAAQSVKCERLVRDIKTYMEVFEREPRLEKVDLGTLVDGVLDGLFKEGKYVRPRMEINIEPDASNILADLTDMRALFGQLLENSLEALAGSAPYIRILSKVEGAPPHSLIVEIFNTGVPLEVEDSEQLFSPFYSTKPGGSGFGLSIARQAVRNNLGRLQLEPVEGEGTRAVVTLPLFERPIPGSA